MNYLFGIDEVGRGPVAGPVSLCAFKISQERYLTLSQNGFFSGIKDSKKLTEKNRESWYKKFEELSKNGYAEYVYLTKSARQIDEHGINQCLAELVKSSLTKLNAHKDDLIMLDGLLRAPKKYTNQQTIIKGDEKIDLISSASIIAKVIRDKHMTELSKKVTLYGFETNKGYGTRNHIEAIRTNGLSIHHRKSYLKSHF